jgi:hypothetical protein
MRAHSLLMALGFAALAACSHRDADAPATSAAGPAHALSAAAPKAPAPSPVTANEKPFEQYGTGSPDGLAWVALYYGVSGAPVDYAAVAGRLDPAYQKTTDAFAQRDALASLKARLDPAIAKAKADPYIQLPPVVTRMPAYDVEHGHYDLTTLVGDGHGMTVADGNARVVFAANPGLSAYAPATEADARALEHAIAANPLGREAQLTIYGKVVAAEARGGTPQLTVVPTRVVVLNDFADGHTEPLFTATTVP